MTREQTRRGRIARRARGIAIAIGAGGALLHGLGCASVGDALQRGLNYDDSEYPPADPEGLAPESPIDRIRSQASTTEQGWATQARLAREAMRIGDLPAVERHYLAALEATRALPPHDARGQTALGNLARLAELYSAKDLEADAERIVEILIDEIRAGRLVEFDLAGPLLIHYADTRDPQLQNARAIEAYQLAMELPGSDAVTTDVDLHVRQRLGIAYVDAGELDKAAALLESLVVDIESIEGRGTARHAIALQAMAYLEAEKGAFIAAEALYRSVLETLEDLGPDSPAMALARNEYAGFLLSRGRAEEAIESAGASLGIVDAAGAKGPIRAAALATIAEGEWKLGRLPDARRHFEEAIAEYEGKEGAPRGPLIEVLEPYAELLATTGRESEAAAIRVRIDAERLRGVGAADAGASPQSDASTE